MTPEETLESYKLGTLKLVKSGYATEQDPFPICDPITGKGYEIKLGKEYLMPRYMEGVLRDCQRPTYEAQQDATGNATQFKKMVLIGLNIHAKPLTKPKDEYLADNPNTEFLFSVDKRLIDEAKGQAPAAKKGGKPSAEEPTI